MSQPLGQPVYATFKTYTDDALQNLGDPTSALIYVKAPDGTVTPHAWPSGDLERVSLGYFRWPIPDDVEGLWQWRGVATGTIATASLPRAIHVWGAFPATLLGLEDAKLTLNMSSTVEDDELQTLIWQASAILLNHPRYRIADVVTPTTYVEEHDGMSDQIVLDHYPVNDITSVVEWNGGASQTVTYEPTGTTSFSTAGYRRKAATGILYRSSGGLPTYWNGQVLVTYTAGSGAVPADIRGAALKLVKHLWGDQRGSGAGRAVPGGVGDEFLPPETAHLLPWEVEEALAAYRRDPVIA